MLRVCLQFAPHAQSDRREIAAGTDPYAGEDMQRIAARCLLGTALLMTGACGGPADDSGAGLVVEDDTHAVAPDHAADETGAGHETHPLRPIMQRLASDMAGFTHALWLEDYDEMTARAAAIAEHPHISAEEIERIGAELGPEMAAFESADEAVHLSSVRLHEAAQARQLDDVLATLSEVQSGCMACHIRFRDPLRTDTIVAPSSAGTVE